jgi:hypothetical protein
MIARSPYGPCKPCGVSVWGEPLVSIRQQPFRTPARFAPAVASTGPTDPIVVAYCASRVFLFVWAGLRLAVCVFRGLDPEGLVALVLVIAALPGPPRRMA